MTTTRDGWPRPAAPPGRLVAGPLLALAAGCAAGAVVGTAVGAAWLAGASGGDDWAALGAFVLGAVVGLAAAAVAWVLALVVAARRLFPPGRRGQPVLLTLAGSAATAVYGAVLLGLHQPAPAAWTALVPVLGLGAAACGPAAFLWSGAGHRHRQVAAAGVLVLAVAAGAVVALSAAVGRAGTDRVAAETPLVLFGGTTADPGFPGWRRDRFATLGLRPSHSFTDRGHEGYLKYFTPGGVTFVTMHTDAGDCAAAGPAYTCSTAGELPDGELRSYVRTASYGTYPQADRYLALVYPDGSAVSVDVEPGPYDDPAESLAQARSVLASLERVDRDRFEDQAGTSLSLG